MFLSVFQVKIVMVFESLVEGFTRALCFHTQKKMMDSDPPRTQRVQTVLCFISTEVSWILPERKRERENER